MYGGYSYLEPDYEPSKDDFIAVFWLSGKKPIEVLAEAVASESSVGTWTSVATMNSFVWEKLRARVFKIEKITENSGFVFIAYPYEHFEEKNPLQLFAGVRGNLFGLKELTAAILFDLKLPERYLKQFPGPKNGIKGIRKYLGTLNSKRPHVGTIIKPKVGLTPKEFAEAAGKAFMAGLDLVKDDENLVDQSFCRWEERVKATVAAAERAMDATGEAKIYVPNITGPLEHMKKRIDFLEALDWKMCMIDVYVIGTAGVMEILKELHERGFIVHAHRAGHAAETRGNFGVSFAFHEKFLRLFGVDQLHTGTGVGKMEGSAWVIRKYGEIARKELFEGAPPIFLQQSFRGIKPFFPVASGGLHPGLVEAVVAVYGTTDVLIQAGGGVHGHPGGTEGGARAMRQAADAVAEGIPLSEAPGKELQQAIEKWGYVPAAAVHEKLQNYAEGYPENLLRRLKEESFFAFSEVGLR